MKFGQDCCQPLIQAQKELAARGGKRKRAITVSVVPEDILTEAKQLAGGRMVPALLTHKKLDREAAVKAVTDDVGAKLVAKFGAEKVTEHVLREAFYYIQKEAVRGLIMQENKRLDGRGFDEIRPITCEVGILPRAHGSALFSRGETQAVTLVTLGTTEDAQEFDSYTGGETQKKFILHYNFPNYSVGETGRISGPGRREIGHGALAERSIEPMLPLETYPYAVRVTSEIMESNGSTSMATVCGGTLALLDAGVPLTRPVAGISIGICTEHDDLDKISAYKLMTDIIGWEDAFCDMDCKIAGTEKGITGFQLDLKLRGLPHNIIAEALEKALPKRYFDVGIAEEHAVIFAAGMATMGFHPVCAIYSTFLQRAYDCIVHDVALQDLPVIFCMDRAGLSANDGPTHHGLFDIAYLRCVPNIISMAPRNEDELADMMFTATHQKHPAFIRYPRGAGEGVTVKDQPALMEIGKAEVTRNFSAKGGRKVALFGLGNMHRLAEQAAVQLTAEGFDCAVINPRFIKPMDAGTTEFFARGAELVVTLEDHVLPGGYGAGVLEFLNEKRVATHVLRIGWPDQFIEHATTEDYLREKYGLTAAHTVAQVKALMAKEESARLTAVA